MTTFVWEAKTRIGETRTGEMDAASSDVVSQRLRSQHLQVVRVRKKPVQIELRLPGQSGVSQKDLMVFTRQFATMIDAGLPMVQCLEILGNQLDNPTFRKIVTDVKGSVESGSTLADALRKHPKVFNRLFVNLVEAGETGGILDTILNRLAEYIEKSGKLVKQVRRALVYPAITMAVALAVSAVLLIWVIPVFERMFADFGQELPGMTKAVITASQFTNDHAGILFVFLVVLGVGGTMFLKSRTGRRLWDLGLLKFPAVGQLVRKFSVARFTRTMGTMLSSGVPILEALEVVSASAGNVIIEEGLLTVRDKISEGKPMSEPLSEISAFPPMVVQMIAVGESTGAMDAMLTKIADFYDDEVDAAIGTMMSTIEPLIMVFMAILLGGLAISMYLPVFTMAGSVGG